MSSSASRVSPFSTWHPYLFSAPCDGRLDPPSAPRKKRHLLSSLTLYSSRSPMALIGLGAGSCKTKGLKNVARCTEEVTQPSIPIPISLTRFASIPHALHLASFNPGTVNKTLRRMLHPLSSLTVRPGLELILQARGAYLSSFFGPLLRDLNECSYAP